MAHNCCNVFLSKLEVLPEWNSAQQVTPVARVARGWCLLVHVREITTVLDHDTNQTTEQGREEQKKAGSGWQYFGKASSFKRVVQRFSWP
jgi:hypothetical protein